MKKLTRIALIVTMAAVATTKTACAVNYNSANNDLLLVFRKANSKDMVFDIGSVSNYLNVASGATVPVTGYSTNQVYTNFNSSFTGVLFILAATTSDTDPSPRVWVTDADLVTVPNSLTVNEFSTLNSKVSGVGNSASIRTAYNPATAWVITASDSDSYSSIVSPGNTAGIPTWDGNLNFVAEATSGNTQKFYELKLNPATPPGKLIGSFTMAANGVITFTRDSVAAPLVPATITGVTTSGNTRTISFTTTNSANYRLVYATSVTATSWTQLPGSVTGNNGIRSLTDTSTDPQRYYKVQTY